MSAHPAPPLPITTLTINPALDVSTSTPTVMAEHKMRCGPSRLDPGGGGVNVSRVIARLGGQSTAIYAVGGPTGQAYRQLLEAEGIVGRAVPIAGSTRENITVDETETGKQFRFVLQGPEVTEPEWQAALAATLSTARFGGYVVPSGSLPPGVPDDFYARVTRAAHESGARVVVDASGEALAAALDEGVYLIKPSGRELGELVGSTLSTVAEKTAAATELVARGRVEVVALTLGGDGAVLVTRDGAQHLAPPPIEVHSTVGAGDSFLAGLVLRLAEGRSLEVAFRAGVACGAATAMTAATELCHADDVRRLEAELAA
ncbi:6-phosphofructokinase [Microcella putealis]|uniref:6-phosphofructokinase n=1 Tax=Microcella putealis TaxID=337005 RepID=A0A4Q7LNQ5_9MICO|nr:1-phosphofructokinase family hexose kinase [Microcella putealis]RZS56345.1 6-phosphofructokinase [Microcella putealis]TQM27169.1 6-phosphofructokinase [Microcella putealis]